MHVPGLCNFNAGVYSRRLWANSSEVNARARLVRALMDLQPLLSREGRAHDLIIVFGCVGERVITDDEAATALAGSEISAGRDLH